MQAVYGALAPSRSNSSALSSPIQSRLWVPMPMPSPPPPPPPPPGSAAPPPASPGWALPIPAAPSTSPTFPPFPPPASPLPAPAAPSASRAPPPPHAAPAWPSPHGHASPPPAPKHTPLAAALAAPSAPLRMPWLVPCADGAQQPGAAAPPAASPNQATQQCGAAAAPPRLVSLHLLQLGEGGGGEEVPTPAFKRSSKDASQGGDGGHVAPTSGDDVVGDGGAVEGLDAHSGGSGGSEEETWDRAGAAAAPAAAAARAGMRQRQRLQPCWDAGLASADAVGVPREEEEEEEEGLGAWLARNCVPGARRRRGARCLGASAKDVFRVATASFLEADLRGTRASIDRCSWPLPDPAGDVLAPAPRSQARSTEPCSCSRAPARRPPW